MGTVVVERVIDLLLLILLIAASAALLPGQIERAFPGMRMAATLTLVLAVTALVVILVVSAYQDRGVAPVQRLLSRVSPRLGHTVVEILSRFIHGLTALRTPSAYLEILVSSCLLSLGYILITWLSFARLRLPGGALAIDEIAMTTSAASLPRWFRAARPGRHRHLSLLLRELSREAVCYSYGTGCGMRYTCTRNLEHDILRSRRPSAVPAATAVWMSRNSDRRVRRRYVGVFEE